MMFTKDGLADWLMARAAYHRHRCNYYTGEARKLKKHAFYVPYEDLWRYDELLALADNEMLYAAILYEEAKRVQSLRAHELVDDICKFTDIGYGDETDRD